MNEQDLEQAREIYRNRRHVQSSLDSAIAVETFSLKAASVNLSFENERTPSGVGHISLDAHSAREVCTLIKKLLEERLRDIDASLRAFGCEPPKPAASALVMPLHAERKRK